MWINMSDDDNISPDPETYCEKVASQEEIYLEETEEELRAILVFDDTSPDNCSTLAMNRGEQDFDREVGKARADANNSPHIARSLDEQLNQAAEELITGDSDDPPLSQEAVIEMVRMTSQVRRLEGK